MLLSQELTTLKVTRVDTRIWHTTSKQLEQKEKDSLVQNKKKTLVFVSDGD